MTRERIEDRLREREELFRLLHSRLPYEEFRFAEAIIQGFLTDTEDETIERTVAITAGAERYGRLRRQHDECARTLEAVSETCLAQNFRAVRPHLLAWGEFVERDAGQPFRTHEEIRGELLTKVNRTRAEMRRTRKASCPRFAPQN
jgi:hypothetical protein